MNMRQLHRKRPNLRATMLHYLVRVPYHILGCPFIDLTTQLKRDVAALQQERDALVATNSQNAEDIAKLKYLEGDSRFQYGSYRRFSGSLNNATARLAESEGAKTDLDAKYAQLMTQFDGVQGTAISICVMDF